MDSRSYYPRSRSTGPNLRMKQSRQGGIFHNCLLSYRARSVGAELDSPTKAAASFSLSCQSPTKLDHARAKQHGDLCLWRNSATVGLLQQRRKRQLLRRIWQSLLLGFCPPCSRPSDEIELRKLKPVRRRFISFASIPTIQFLFCLGNSSSCTSLSVTASLCRAIYEDSRFSSLRYWQVWMKDKK